MKIDVQEHLVKKAQSWLQDPKALFGDVETTGFFGNHEVVEVTLLNANEEVVYYSKFEPACDFHPEASKVNGLTKGMLVGEPLWSQKQSEIEAVVSDRNLVFFNSGFDWKMLRQTAKLKDGLDSWDFNTKSSKDLCAMKLAVEALELDKKRVKLKEAMKSFNVAWRGAQHTALADTLGMLDMIKAIAKCNPVVCPE